MPEAVARYHCPACGWHVATRREGSLRATGHVLRLEWQDGRLLWAAVRCTNRACRAVCEVRLCDHPLTGRQLCSTL